MADPIPAPLLYWRAPFRADNFGIYVFDADDQMILQIRGWGHLTGTGGLQLGKNEAVAVQEARGKAIAEALNRAYGEEPSR